MTNRVLIPDADPQSFTNDEAAPNFVTATVSAAPDVRRVLENISQALARVIVMNAALRIRKCGLDTNNVRDYEFKMQAHDELVYIIKDENLEQAKTIIHTEMTRSPTWGRDIPLVGTGKSYGECK